MNDIKSFDFDHIQKCPFGPIPLHFRNASAASGFLASSVSTNQIALLGRPERYDVRKRKNCIKIQSAKEITELCVAFGVV